MRASRYLGTRVATSGDSADFVLELNMRSFGIDARSAHATYLFTRAKAVLIDRRSGMEIWREDARGSDRLTPFVVGTRQIPRFARKDRRSPGLEDVLWHGHLVLTSALDPWPYHVATSSRPPAPPQR